ncbi:hypothetical protein CJI97_001875 [Candidozyma auris]|nr:hypothetical protein CJI97_001875 [[Candida] auris]
MTIPAAFVPFIHFLSISAYESWKQVNMVSSVLIILYSLTSISLLGLAYFFQPTRKDENLYTYQPWWIESFSPFYFVKKNAAREAEETFMKRNSNHRHAIRVIAATHHHYNMVEGLTNQRGVLKHNKSLLIVSVSTILIFVGAVFRSITIFQNKRNYDSSWVCDYRLLIVIYGGFEAFINVLYLVGRVDLRFYRPDRLPAKVRAIITAEQTFFNSPVTSEDEDDDAISSGSDGYSKTDSFSDQGSFEFIETAIPSESVSDKHVLTKNEFEKGVDDLRSDSSSTVSDFQF